MKTIQTKSGEILLVKVPGDIFDFELSWFDSIRGKNKKGEYVRIHAFEEDNLSLEIVGKFSELKDKDFEDFVEKGKSNICYRKFGHYGYKHYTEEKYSTALSAKASFKTLCKSQGIEDDLSNYLIIKKV